MNIKNIDLLRCVPPMKLLCEKDNIPFKTALLISANVAEIDSAIEKYLSEKKKITEKFSENGTSAVKKGNEEQFLLELTQLNDKTTELNINKIDPDLLENITFPPKYINCIGFMLETH